MILRFVTFFVLINIVVSQNPSPCPEIFSYEPKQPGDRWYGAIKFSLRQSLSGIWLRVTLDRPADILGNWFGQVTTSDNTVYDIRRPEYVLQEGVTLSVRLFVKYNLAQIIPSLESIKLNGQTICAVQRKRPSTTPKPDISRKQIENVTNVKPQATVNNTKSSSSHVKLLAEEFDPDSEGYPGDYNIVPISPRVGPAKSEKLKAPTCGIIEPRNTSVSSSGDTWRGQWPWHAALYRSKDANLVYICGATLITEQYVVAPAHCVTRYHTKYVEQPNSFVVSLGKFSLTRFETDIQDTVLSEIVIHPEYDNWLYINDIAVLKLSKPVRITNFVRPSCLWDKDYDLKNIIGKEGTIVGWGTDKSRKLMHTKMTIVPLENCVFSEYELDNIYCAEFVDGLSACNIKSISGMVIPKEGTNGENTMWQIRGINIYSEIQVPCDETKYKLFTDVAKYSPWIQEIINNDKKNS